MKVLPDNCKKSYQVEVMGFCWDYAWKDELNENTIHCMGFIKRK